ncbi:hypothetical protein V6N13_125461 [Hibiscus sabdariffa]|uniref:PPIase cyclophilin-type domain-containing protein n=1 Tax=Hibiscus sabdariffa TaxID=183260 RepID=A0ABR2U5N8_9ROSI
MLNNLKFLQSSPWLLQPPSLASRSFPILQHLKFSRRELTVCTNSSLLLLLGSQTLEPLYPLSKAKAEENLPDDNVTATKAGENSSYDNFTATKAEENSSHDNVTATKEEENSADDNVTATKAEENSPGDNVTATKEEENSADDNVTTIKAEENSPGDNVTATKEEENSADDNVTTIKAEENSPDDKVTTTPNPNCSNRVATKRAFLDIAIDGEPAGRIVIGLYGDDVPAGAARFSSIVSGAAGISYRRKEFIKIMPNYVQHGGLRSYGVDAELAKKTGSNLAVETLKEEWERGYDKCPGVKNLAGTVSLLVRDPSKPPPKLKLVARKGKLEIDQEEVGTEPNGTEFVISINDSPELDASALVIGQVLDGIEVVKRIGQVKTVQENTGSPYFRVAKLIGDKRAVVAERGFNRPYAKVSRRSHQEEEKGAPVVTRSSASNHGDFTGPSQTQPPATFSSSPNHLAYQHQQPIS